MAGQAIATINGYQWQVSLATSDIERATGLSGVASMPAGTGMLFIMPGDSLVTVTTAPMSFPIDIVFISNQLRVVSIAHNTPPGMLVTEDTPVRYFLEVNAGETEGIEAGDSVDVTVLSMSAPDPLSPVISVAGVMLAGAFMVSIGKTIAGAMFDKPQKPFLYGPKGEKLLPSTRKLTRDDVTVESWVERDRTGIWVTDRKTNKTIAQWWDGGARQMFEDGFFKAGDIRHQEITGKAFEESVLDYLEGTGVLRKSGDKELLPGVCAMPKLPDEARKDALFVTYIRDLIGLGQRVTDEEARVMWEAWKKRELARLPHVELLPLAVVPTGSRLRRKKPEDLEFLPDSLEFLAYTIEDIGYREKLDNAFQTAISRTRGVRK